MDDEYNMLVLYLSSRNEEERVFNQIADRQM